MTIAIKSYIQDALPVASEAVARSFDLSPATIRNIFVDLEESGYLMHPYTSGGRVPTDKGYRFYVDFLISQMELLDEEKERIAGEYKLKVRKLESALEETSELISEITHYAGIASFMEWQDKLFCNGISRVLEQPEFRNLDKIRLLIKMFEEKQRLLDIINRGLEDDEAVKVYIGQELECVDMEGCSLVISSYRIKNKPQGRLAVLGPVRMEYSRIIPRVKYVSCLLSEALDSI